MLKRIDLSRDLSVHENEAQDEKTAHFVNQRKSLELLHKPMESTMYYENTVLESPKQLNIGGKGKYCCIPVGKNAQYGKDWQKTNLGLFKLRDKDAKPKLYK